MRRGQAAARAGAAPSSPGWGAGPLMRRGSIWLAVPLVVAACGGSPGAATHTTPTTGAETAAVAASGAGGEDGIVTTAAEAPSTTAAAATTEAPATTLPGAEDDRTTVPTSAASTGDGTGGSPEPDPPQPLIEGLGPEASAQVWRTARTVEEIRGLEFDGLPSITVLSPEEFAERVRMEVASDLEDVEVDEALFKLLGLLAPGDDLEGLYEELYGESVAGFYSSEHREMVLPRSGEEFSAVETVTLLHELVHALTDQHFGFGATLDSLVEIQLYDQASALVSLVEGDATLSEVLYYQGLSEGEQLRLLTEFDEMEQPDLDIPLFMERSLYFPYERGFEYVLNAWQGDWRAVNDLYLDPPASTEEIYDGAASPGARPVEMARPAGVLPEGYAEIYDYTWGFLDILLMFEQVLGDETAVRAATGWGGGRSLVGYSEEGEVVFVWEFAGDSPEEAEELAGLLHDYAVEGMDVGAAVRGEGDLTFSAAAGDYVFVSLIPEGLVMVACSDPQVCPSVAAPYHP